LLDPFLDTFHDEQPLVQLALVSSLVKVYCEKPDATRDQLQFVLSEATKPGSVPDVKNRALIYWRVLSADVRIAKQMLQFSKQTVAHSGVRFDDAVLAELIRNMGSVAGVLHVVPSEFVSRVRFVPDEEEAEALALRQWHRVRLNNNGVVDIYADFAPRKLFLRIVSLSQAPLSAFAIAINRNVLGIVVDGSPKFPDQLELNEVADVVVALRIDPNSAGNAEQKDLQIAFRTNGATVYGLDRIPAEVAAIPGGDLGPDRFKQCFSSFEAATSFVVEEAAIASDDVLKEAGVFVAGKNGNKTYVSFVLAPANVFVAEIIQNARSLGVNIKGSSSALFPVIEASARWLFAQK
jgi:hypothetical protein